MTASVRARKQLSGSARLLRAVGASIPTDHLASASDADGRHLRSERTRQALAGALLQLLDEGKASPTTGEIAERAGVSKRTVFNHFPDRGALLEELVARRHEPLNGVTADLALDERISRFVEVRAKTLALLTPLERSVRALAVESPPVRKRLRAAQRELAAEVQDVFSAEIRAHPPAAREPVAAALVAATAWTAWEQYRLHQDLTPDRAQAAMRSAIVALLRTP